ncbi:MAG: hypothetical protein ACYC7A_21740 [Thermoanaerobaculia bacterium]
MAEWTITAKLMDEAETRRLASQEVARMIEDVLRCGAGKKWVDAPRFARLDVDDLLPAG